MASRRYHALDGLRGVAAVAVVFHHVSWTNHTVGLAAVHNGYLAVDLFFVLSGFVIAASYDGRIVDATSARDFLVMRFFRVYPLHVFVLTGLVALEGLKFLPSLGKFTTAAPFTGFNSVPTLLANLTLTQNWGFIDHLSWNFPSWSISSEFGAYILFALVASSGTTRTLDFWRVLAAFGAVGYIALAISYQSLDITYDLGLIRCICGFSLGIWLFQRRSATVVGWPRKFDVVIAFAVCAGLTLASGPWVACVVGLMALLVAIVADDAGPVAAILQRRVCQLLGEISYSIYLVHVPIRLILLMVLERFGLMREGPYVVMNVWTGDLLTFGYLAAVLVVASITHRLIEEPARRFGRHLVRREKAAAALEPS